ncbi:MAG: mechanosensitive ion channel [Desulfobacterales bacterium]
MTRPFVVGDTVTIEGVSGVVEEVTLATTILSTEDGEKITIPNKNIVGEIQTNSFENKVVEASVGISYDDDPGKGH